MNAYLAAAAVLAVVVGLVHSILGETLIFARLRRGRVIPSDGGTALRPRHVRILWASWHLLTIFAWALVAVLVRVADAPAAGALRTPVLFVVAGAMLLGALLVGVATAGRHPGWVGLLGVAVLCALGAVQ